MKTLDENTKAIQFFTKTDSNTMEDINTETIPLKEEWYLTGKKSVLFQMYELEEDDLFI